MSTSAVIEKNERSTHVVRKEERKPAAVREAAEKKIKVNTLRNKLYHQIIFIFKSLLLVILFLGLYKVTGLEHLWAQLLDRFI